LIARHIKLLTSNQETTIHAAYTGLYNVSIYF
jgi:hypothetical protein